MSSIRFVQEGRAYYKTSVMMLVAILLMETRTEVVAVELIPARPGVNGPRLSVTFEDDADIRSLWNSFHDPESPQRLLTLSRTRQIDSLAAVLRYFAKNRTLPSWTLSLQKEYMRRIVALCG